MESGLPPQDSLFQGKSVHRHGDVWKCKGCVGHRRRSAAFRCHGEHPEPDNQFIHQPMPPNAQTFQGSFGLSVKDDSTFSWHSCQILTRFLQDSSKLHFVVDASSQDSPRSFKILLKKPSRSSNILKELQSLKNPQRSLKILKNPQISLKILRRSLWTKKKKSFQDRQRIIVLFFFFYFFKGEFLCGSVGILRNPDHSTAL